MSDDPAGDIQAALRDKFMPDIVVAQYIVKRNIVFGPEPGQIFRGQIATAEYQINGIRIDSVVGADKVGHDDI